MRALLVVAAVVGLAGAASAQQPIPPQPKNNDASLDGAASTKPPVARPANPAPERGDDRIDTLGRTGPSGDTTTGSALPGGATLEGEIDATIGTMDDDKSQVDRHRSPRQQRR